MKNAYRLILIIAIFIAIAMFSSCAAQPLPPGTTASPAEATAAVVVIECGEQQPDGNPSSKEPLVFVAHAGGFAEGYTESNSAEALRSSAEYGYTLIELDIITTSDGRFALAHDWEYMSNRVPLMPNEPVTAQEFLSYKWFGSLTTVMLDYLFEGYLDEFPSVRIVTDTKRGDYSSLEYIAETYPDYIDRFIPQAYAFEDCDTLRTLGFKDIIVTVYAMPVSAKESPALLAQRALEFDVYAMTIPFELASADDYAAALRTGEIKYFVHTVNSPEQAVMLAELGFCGVYTDTLTYSGGTISVLDDEAFYAGEAARYNRAIAALSDNEREILADSVVCIAGSELIFRHGTAEMIDASAMISCFAKDEVFFLPLRKIIGYLNAGTVNSAADGTISVETDGFVLELEVGRTEMTQRTNGTAEIIALPIAPAFYRNVCFVPQAVLEALGFRVTVSGDTTIIVSANSHFSEEVCRLLAEKISKLLSK